jgi:hypothetical protein
VKQLNSGVLVERPEHLRPVLMLKVGRTTNRALVLKRFDVHAVPRLDWQRAGSDPATDFVSDQRP